MWFAITSLSCLVLKPILVTILTVTVITLSSIWCFSLLNEATFQHLVGGPRRGPRRSMLPAPTHLHASHNVTDHFLSSDKQGDTRIAHTFAETNGDVTADEGWSSSRQRGLH